VALFVAGVAFPPGAIQDAAKMGALLSFGAAGIATAVGRLMRVERQPAPAMA
jgi:NhaA family Na+:H+ antiporter